ncbi:MAG: FHA domain-containing protein, partial [Eubacteriales bacterium]|nr:FHA domain-containing protein [Eubacteriales bacterium]
MHGKIIMEITDGVQAGQKFEYTEADRIFIGRQDDCGIVLPEKTVSRYHCVLTINPPTVRLQDFGSLNGTFINGKKIGQRDRDKSPEEAKYEKYQEFDLHDGDLIRLGKRCELKCSIDQNAISDVTISDEDLGPSAAERAKIEKAERERAEREKAEKEKA